MLPIPLVIVHFGYKPYLEDIIRFNSKKNKIILIGDNDNAHLGSVKNVQHILYFELVTENLIFFKNNFYDINKNIFSTTKIRVDNNLRCDTTFGVSCEYDFLWHARVFLIHEYMIKYNIPLIFHTDSDCAIFEPIDTLYSILPQGTQTAYSIEHIHNNIHMVGSIHASFLTLQFCEEYKKLLFAIYIERTKIHLLETKINAQQNGAPGFICDMSLYYCLWKEGSLPIFDLNTYIYINNEICTFDHALADPLGLSGKESFKMEHKENVLIKKLQFKNNAYYAETENGNFIRLLSIHFNCNTKPFIKEFLENIT